MNDTVIVQESVKGKFGPQVKDMSGNYYSFGKFYKGSTDFEPNTQLLVDVFVSEKGNKYINKVEKVILPEVSDKPKKKVVKVAEQPTATTTTYPVKIRDFDLEAYGKCKALLVQSLMPMLITNPQNEEEVKEKVKIWVKFIMLDDRDESNEA